MVQMSNARAVLNELRTSSPSPCWAQTERGLTFIEKTLRSAADAAHLPRLDLQELVTVTPLADAVPVASWSLHQRGSSGKGRLTNARAGGHSGGWMNFFLVFGGSTL